MIQIEELKNQISRRVSGMKDGYFITVDSSLTTLDNNIDRESLYRFSENSVKRICHALNSYCFGRTYRRKEKKIRFVSTLEIGKETQRLHAHLVALHQGDCDKSVDQIEARLRKICEAVLHMSGKNAIDVKKFDRSENWIGYFVKNTQFMQSRYGYMNVELY